MVIAVNLNGDRVGRHTRCADDTGKPQVPHDPGVDAIEQGLLAQLVTQFTGTLRAGAAALIGPSDAPGAPAPGLFDVLSGSLNIMQDRITRSRMAGDPPDLVISPRLGHLGLMEFDRADEAIAAGTRAVEQSMPAIRERCIS